MTRRNTGAGLLGQDAIRIFRDWSQDNIDVWSLKVDASLAPQLRTFGLQLLQAADALENPQREARRALKRARTYFLVGKLDEANTEAKLAKRLSPHSKKAKELLAEIEAKLAEPQPATEATTEATAEHLDTPPPETISSLTPGALHVEGVEGLPPQDDPVVTTTTSSVEELAARMRTILCTGVPSPDGFAINKNRRDDFEVAIITTAAQQYGENGTKGVNVGILSRNPGKISVIMYTSDMPSTMKDVTLTAPYDFEMLLLTTEATPTRMQVEFTPDGLNLPIIVFTDIPKAA